MDERVGVTFGRLHFGAAALGDQRRVERLVRVADRLITHPGGTFPEKLDDPAELRAFYRLMDCDGVTHESVLAPHRTETWRRMREHPGVVLLLHDTTVLDYSGLDSIAELGQIGDGHGRGYCCHNSLAVAAGTRVVFGLAWQILHRRRHVPVGETRAARRQAPDRESRLWKQASRGIPAAPADRLWVDVADRGADLLEFLDYEDEEHKHYLVRSQHNRRIALENRGETQVVKLHDWARTLPAEAQRPLESAGRAQPVQMSVAWMPVQLLPLRQPRGEERGLPLTVWVVRTWEAEPPPGREPLEWILLTNVPVTTAAEAWERCAWYRQRWLIEEYHKGMKTGASIEDMQFTQRARLEPAIALMSVVALTLLQLRDLSRQPQATELLASAVLPAAWVRLLSRRRHGEERPAWTVREFYFALARLGGHQNRKHDHPPGWLVLWRGWTKLQAMLAGAAASGVR